MGIHTHSYAYRPRPKSPSQDPFHPSLFRESLIQPPTACYSSFQRCFNRNRHISSLKAVAHREEKRDETHRFSFRKAHCNVERNPVSNWNLIELCLRETETKDGRFDDIRNAAMHLCYAIEDACETNTALWVTFDIRSTMTLANGAIPVDGCQHESKEEALQSLNANHFSSFCDATIRRFPSSRYTGGNWRAFSTEKPTETRINVTQQRRCL